MLHVCGILIYLILSSTLSHSVRMDKLTPPEVLNLEGNVAKNWRRWKQKFEIFSLASGLNGKDAKIQAATLLHVAGTDDSRFTILLIVNLMTINAR